MEQKDEEIYTEIMKARSRKYFFDVKETRNGDHYVTISETQPKGSNFKRMRIMIFAEYLKDFIDTLNKLTDKVKITDEAIDSKKRSEQRYQEYLESRDSNLN